MAFDFHFPTSKKALIIFTRNPELGQCKTRLAKTIGDEAALKIYS
ncbi:MAG TPA: glycosyltransferase, partial [Flavobacteriaceae bacterium]